MLTILLLTFVGPEISPGVYILGRIHFWRIEKNMMTHLFLTYFEKVIIFRHRRFFVIQVESQKMTGRPGQTRPLT